MSRLISFLFVILLMTTLRASADEPADLRSVKTAEEAVKVYLDLLKAKDKPELSDEFKNIASHALHFLSTGSIFELGKTAETQKKFDVTKLDKTVYEPLIALAAKAEINLIPSIKMAYSFGPAEGEHAKKIDRAYAEVRKPLLSPPPSKDQTCECNFWTWLKRLFT